MKSSFGGYQTFVIALLAFIQFTVIVDFMILSLLGALLLSELHISTRELGLLISAYALGAAVSGLLMAGFADRIDRKRLLLVLYCGFLLGTLGSGLAPGYRSLLLARLVTGMFGGVIGSINLAIAADLFRFEVRGRVMGGVQIGFATSQVLGVPAGLYLSNRLGWHAPFLFVAALGLLAAVTLGCRLRPIVGHLARRSERSALSHLSATLRRPDYVRGFVATILLSIGGFMLMPFGTTFTVNNMGIAMERLPLLYLCTGLFAVVAAPLLGRLCDAIGKYPTFLAGTIVGMVIVSVYCRLGATSFWSAVAIHAILFTAISARTIPSLALNSAVPAAHDRAAYMVISASLQQVSGAFASALAGLIVVQIQTGELEHYDVLGYVVVVAMAVTLWLMYSVHRIVQARSKGGELRVTYEETTPPGERGCTGPR